MRTCVVDVHMHDGVRAEFDEYVGHKVKGTEFVRSSIWCKPRKIRTIAEYEVYIRKKIREMPKTYDLRKLVGKRLGCWCMTMTWRECLKMSLRCHAQVLVRLIHEFGYE